MLTGMPATPQHEYIENGQMEVRLGHSRTGVEINFRRNVSRLTLTPEQALAFAEAIKAQALEAKIGL